MQHLESLTLLEQRIQRAVDLIAQLKVDKKRLEEETAKLLASQSGLERRAQQLEDEKDELSREGREYREKEEEWVQYERDREEIRTRIDNMLAKFEELEI